MSSRYSETQTYRSENRRDNDGYEIPYSQQLNLPIQSSTSIHNPTSNELRVQERLRQQDTTVQWFNDPISGKQKFRVHINIEGFNPNEVNIRVEGNKLIIFGEHVENKNQSTAKKTIEKSYELPYDIDSSSPHVVFPTSTTMQVDFPSRHSNVIIDDGRTSSNLITNYDTSYRPLPGFTQQKSSTEYTSTRKIGGGIDTRPRYGRSSSPRYQSSYDQLSDGSNIGRQSSYSSSTQYRSTGDYSPPRRGFIDTTRDSYANPIDSSSSSYSYQLTSGDSQPRTTYPSTSRIDNGTTYEKSFSSSRRGFGDTTRDLYTNPTNSSSYSYQISSGDSQPRTTYPLTSRGDSGTVYEKSYSESRRESHHRRSSPTTGVQSSHEVEHHRSGSPSLRSNLDEDRFRSSVTIGPSRIISSPSTTRDVEVREYSRRVGTGLNDSLSITEPSVFTRGFNSDAFYRSAFQPQILNDDRGQKRIEMKLDVSNYDPNDIKVSINGNDLIVQAEHNTERPPTSSSRAYFYKQITLPPNTDLNSLSSKYHPDGKLYITANIHPEQAAIRYN